MRSDGKMRIGRVHEPLRQGEHRVLVDRLWPRGFKKQDPRIGRWIPELAPSAELRRWYDHQESRREEFAERYREELEALDDTEEMATMRELAKDPGTTLVTATKHLEQSQVPILAAHLDAEVLPTAPQSDPVMAIERWEAFGGTWTVVRDNDDGIEIALNRCDGGEQVESITSDDTTLREWIASRRA